MSPKPIALFALFAFLLVFLAACAPNTEFRINSRAFDTTFACRGAEMRGGICTDTDR